MQSIFDTCIPRDDVLQGALTEDVFAADLDAVVRGSAPAVYREPATFFANTYPTASLKTLVAEVFGRFRGEPASSPILRLETSFGGGKTHDLIALWHFAKDPAASRAAAAHAAVPWAVDGLSTAGVQVAALSGDKYGASDVAQHPDAITRTLWGEIGWQIGNYAAISADDQQRLAPSSSTLDKVFAGRPTLILLDELAAYLAGAQGLAVGAGTLADQTLRFFHLLLGYAASHDKLVVVYTLAESRDAYGAQTTSILQSVRDAKLISARDERVLTPVSEEETPQILKSRLFTAIDQSAGPEVAKAYAEAYRKASEQGAAIPSEALGVAYQRRIASADTAHPGAYPFHPELLATLYRKTASFANFQRTRGALRLLAAVVRSLWRDRSSPAYLIQSTDVDLAAPQIRNELTSRLDRARLTVAISADIWSQLGDAHAQKLDAEDWAPKGYPHFVQRVAQAIFLHSLVAGNAGAVGADLSEVLLATLWPGLSFDLVERALDQIDKGFWYADFDGRRYFFKEEPTLKKLIEDAASDVTTIAAKDAARQKIREVFGTGGTFEAVFFPAGPETVPDDDGKPRLVLLDFDQLSQLSGVSTIPNGIEDIFTYKGQTHEFRRYRNNLVALAAESGEVSNLVASAKKAMALARLSGDQTVRRQLNADQLRRLNEQKDTSELEYRVAITNAYRHLFYPSPAGLEHYPLAPQDTNTAKRQQQSVIRDQLVTLGQALVDSSEPPAPDYVWDKAWPAGSASEEVSTLDLTRTFREKPRLKMIFDVEPLKKTIQKGVDAGIWVYTDGTRVYRKGAALPTNVVAIGSNAELLTPARADQVYPPPAPTPLPTIQETERTTSTRTPTRGQTNGVDGATPQPQPQPRPAAEFSANGKPPAVFVNLRDQLRDAKVPAIRLLRIDLESAEDLRALGAALTALQAAAQSASAELWVTQTLEKPGEPHELCVNFAGPARYYQRIRTVTTSILDDVGGDHEFIAAGSVELAFEPPLALSDSALDRIAADLESYGTGEISILAEPS